MRKLKVLSLVLAVILLMGSFCGCEKKETIAQLPHFINEMDVDVIDDLPDWTGSELDLSVWMSVGTNHPAIGKTKSNDKFQEEISRVSGITFSEKTSFDNGGESCDAQIAKMTAAKSWPHIGVGVENNIATMLFEEGLIYDLTDYIEKYMPNYMSYVNKSEELKAEIQRNTHNGKQFQWTGISKYAAPYLDDEYTAEKYEKVIPPDESRGWFWIRDDILTAIHPQAHTVKELQDIYMKNGDFTKEEICDFTIKSKEEFRKLLEDINALDIKENGRKVWPFYLTEGTDNWSLLTEIIGIAGGGFGLSADYFSYYDAQQEKIVNTAKQPWFKELLGFYNELYRDGLASEEAFIDNKATFEQKKNNGEYAIIYGLAVPPSEEVLKAGGKDYAYRKVFFDIPVDHERFASVNARRLTADYGMIFFKDKLSESQLELVLRFIDFFYTDAGMKFAMYGPKKSGLYEETEDGKITYTDKAFESAMLFGGDVEVKYDYGYESFPPITQFVGGSLSYYNKYHPQLMYKDYEAERIPSDYVNEFKISKVYKKADYPRAASSWAVYSYSGKVSGIKSMWDARQAVEDAILLTLASKTEDDFEKNYTGLIDIEERNGYDDKCLDEFNKVYAKENKEYMDGIINWQYNN